MQQAGLHPVGCSRMHAALRRGWCSAASSEPQAAPCPRPCRLKPLRNLLSLQLHAREIRGALPPALFRHLNRLQHLAISARCRLPAGVVRQLTGLRSLELHGASMDEEAAAAAAALQQLTRLCISVQHPGGAGQEGEAAEAAAPGSPPGSRGSSPPSSRPASAASSRGGKGGGGAAAQRWQDHPVWGQLPLLARLQHLAVGAELPAGSSECPGEPAILPYDCLEGAVPDGVMDCRRAGAMHGRQLAGRMHHAGDSWPADLQQMLSIHAVAHHAASPPAPHPAARSRTWRCPWR